jgi:hypothetical protein
MFEERLNTESVPSNISYIFFKTYNLPTQNSYCDSVTSLNTHIYW